MADDFDFGYISQMKVTPETTGEFTFSDIPGEPSLVCAPAIKINRAWDAAVAQEALKEVKAQRAAKPTRKLSDIKPPTFDEEEEARDKERVLIARHCVKDWGTPPLHGKTGKAVPFSEGAVLALLRALHLPDYQQFTRWLQNEWNFVGEAGIPPGAAEAMGEASPTA